ncbi:hypothetical protein ACVOMS_17550 [Bradyrhizobium guangxiense]
MSAFFGPLESDGRVPARQQTRVASFLISAHGALGRRFALALPVRLESAWQTEAQRTILQRIRDHIPAPARNQLDA